MLPPLDWSKTGTETWGDVIRQVKKVGTGYFLSSLLSRDREKKTQAWDAVFKTVRQPEWWQGDSEYHPPLYSDPVSNLEAGLRSGEFVVATELTPPLSASSAKLEKDINLVRPFVTALNFTDASSPTPTI